MEKPINILHLEDEPNDTELVKATLEAGNISFVLTHVQTKEEYIEALKKYSYDIILSDYRLPMYDGISAMQMAQEHCPDIPFIFLSGTMGEDIAIETLTRGATDYVLKHKLSRIVPAINRAFLESKEKNERKRIERLMEIRLRIVETIYASDLSLDKICTLVIDEIESQTGSKIGFFHFLEKDQKTMDFQSWSTNTLATMNRINKNTSHYNVSNAEIWTHCIDTKKPIILNDYTSLPHTNSLLEGYTPVVRELIVPIIRKDLIVAIIGIGDKPTDYDETDIKVITLLGDFSWEIIKRKKAEQLILKEKENFYNILATAPIGLLIVNSNMVITQANNTISSLVSKDLADIIHKRIGNGLGCLHCNQDTQNCGHSDSCHDCSIQQELSTVINGKKNVRGKEIMLSMMVNGKQQNYWLNVNIEPVTFDDSQHFIVAIDNITEKKKLEQERLDNMHFLEGLDKVNRSMQGTSDLEQMMNNVLEVVHNIFNCDRTWLQHPCDPKAKTWQIMMEVVNPEFPGIGINTPIETLPETAQSFSKIIEKNAPVQFGPFENQFEIPSDLSENLNIKSYIAMPVYPKTGTTWTFGMHQCTYARAWTAEEERLFREIGRRIESNLTILLMYREVQTLLSELYHRTKNNMMVICALMNLHSEFHEDDETIVQILTEMENRIRSMALVHEKLYKSKNLSSINIKNYIQDEIRYLTDSYDINKKIHFNLNEIEDVSLLIDSAIPCGLIINELVTNSIKYAFPNKRKGTITIKFKKDQDDYCNLQVSDDGVGVDNDFDFRGNQRMGLTLITNVAEGQLMGEIDFVNKNGISCSIRFKDIHYKKRV